MFSTRSQVLLSSVLVALAILSSTHASRMEAEDRQDPDGLTGDDATTDSYPSHDVLTYDATSDASRIVSELLATAVSVPETATETTAAAIPADAAPVATTTASRVDLTPDEPVPHEAKMWQLKPDAVNVEWGKTSFKGFSFVLEGKDEILVVHGFGSDSAQRQAAAAKASEQALAIGGGHTGPLVRVLELDEQQDHCTAEAEATPRVDCPALAPVISGRALKVTPRSEDVPAYAARIWKFHKVGTKKPQEINQEFGYNNFNKFSFVLDGEKEILVVHGHASNNFQRHAAAAKAHAIRNQRVGHITTRVLELDKKQDHCSASADLQLTCD